MGQIAAWWGKRTNETQNPKSRLFALLELRQVLSYSVLETGRNLRERERESDRVEAIAIWNKKLLGAPGLTTRSKDATRGSWHRY